MTQRVFLDFLHILERLKCNTRHSWTSTGRHETVAAHTWRLAVMALLLRDEPVSYTHLTLPTILLV